MVGPALDHHEAVIGQEPDEASWGYARRAVSAAGSYVHLRPGEEVIPKEGSPLWIAFTENFAAGVARAEPGDGA